MRAQVTNLCKLLYDPDAELSQLAVQSLRIVGSLPAARKQIYETLQPDPKMYARVADDLQVPSHHTPRRIAYGSARAARACARRAHCIARYTRLYRRLQRRLKTYAFVPFENDEAVPRKPSAKPPLSKDQAAAKITAVCRAARAWVHAYVRACVFVSMCTFSCVSARACVRECVCVSECVCVCLSLSLSLCAWAQDDYKTSHLLEGSFGALLMFGAQNVMPARAQQDPNAALVVCCSLRLARCILCFRA